MNLGDEVPYVRVYPLVGIEVVGPRYVLVLIRFAPRFNAIFCTRYKRILYFHELFQLWNIKDR